MLPTLPFLSAFFLNPIDNRSSIDKKDNPAILCASAERLVYRGLQVFRLILFQTIVPINDSQSFAPSMDFFYQPTTSPFPNDYAVRLSAMDLMNAEHRAEQHLP